MQDYKHVVVLGAGLGGKLAACGVRREHPSWDVTLIGPESNEPQGLFYFNEMIPGIAETEISIKYKVLEELDEMAYKNYQIKSRGSYDPNVKVSSFNKVGTTEKGYLLKDGLVWDRYFEDNQICWIKDNCISIQDPALTNINQTKLSTIRLPEIYCDMVISTVPFTVLHSLVFHKNVPEDCLQYSPVYVENHAPAGASSCEFNRIEVVYEVSDSSPYYRMNYYYMDDDLVKISSESLQKTSDNCIALYPGKILPSEYVEEKLSQIESHFNLKSLGRYARWDYHYLVTDTYRDAIEFVSKGE